MRRGPKLVFFLAALVASLLLGTQLHCCLDLNSQSIDSHFCPVCSVAGTAIVTTPPSVELVPALDWLHHAGAVAAAPLVFPRSIVPRAPPASR